MRTTPDPNLQEAMAEIQAILKKRDIAAVIVLSSTDALEYKMEIEPSWSCAKYEVIPGGHGIRIRTTDLPKETKKETLEATVGTFAGFNDILAEIVKVILEIMQQNATVIKMVREQVGEFEHKSERL